MALLSQGPLAGTAQIGEAQASVQVAAWRIRLLCGIE
jgi:hypothetical protein